MSKASIRVETMVLPTYQEPPLEELPIFAEHRDHQRSTGRPYPNKVGYGNVIIMDYSGTKLIIAFNSAACNFTIYNLL